MEVSKAPNRSPKTGVVLNRVTELAMPVMRRLDATRGSDPRPEFHHREDNSWRSIFSLGDRVERAGESRKPAPGAGLRVLCFAVRAVSSSVT